jgi:hypothetical protein
VNGKRSLQDDDQLSSSEEALPARPEGAAAKDDDLDEFAPESTLETVDTIHTDDFAQREQAEPLRDSPLGVPISSARLAIAKLTDATGMLARRGGELGRRGIGFFRSVLRGPFPRSLLLTSAGALAIVIVHLSLPRPQSTIQPTSQPNASIPVTQRSSLPAVKIETITVAVPQPVNDSPLSPSGRATQDVPGRAAQLSDAPRSTDRRAESSRTSWMTSPTAAESPVSGNRTTERSDTEPGRTPVPALSPPVDAMVPLMRRNPPTAFPLVRDVVDTRISDTDAVRQILRQFESAYEELDVVAAEKVWPSVDRRALARAFNSIRSQGLTFEKCDIRVAHLSATALCHGAIQFVPKVGSTVPFVAQQTWLFRMRKSDAAWKITDVSASRQVAQTGARTTGEH